MVPRADDDFILTIGDTEEVPDYDGEAEDAPREPLKGIGKKRKRDDSEVAAAAAAKLKKQKYRKDEALSESLPEPELEGGWAAEGEDDGAMNSDFEFVVDGIDTSTVEDFDGWALGQKDGHGNGPVKSKKGVDIDAIVARRKLKDQTANESMDDEDDDESVGTEHIDSSAESITEDNHADRDGEDFAGFDDEDELLADDAFGMGATEVDNDSVVDADGEKREETIQDEQEDDEQDEESDVAAPVPHPMDLEEGSASEAEIEEEEDPAEAERRAAFFAPEDEVKEEEAATAKGSSSFQHMSLSRPILKGLAAVNFTTPTPIQLKTIPVALLGKDVVGGAVTGSGKTGAFIVPILERLLYRPKKVPTTRVAILMPTRELAVQCFNVARKLASFTDITFACIVGGFSVREQENTLKKRPDVVIATPGRFIDHMRNSQGFAVETIEILVLDEADRMLEEGFADELNEILTTIPKSRQTMLFSATMTSSIDKLISVGLNRPARLQVDAQKQTVKGLVQEFVRLRPGREDKRLAYLLYLCTTSFTTRTIIFFKQKAIAHRVRIVFSLCNLKASELHGSMTQEQRIQAIESFRQGTSNFLLATDVASRGLDIKNVDAVVNYEAPFTHEVYLHRVGRTARAGRTGRSCTLAAEDDRKVVKAAVKGARAQGAQVVSRQVPTEEADQWAAKLTAMETEIESILAEEKEEKLLSNTERDLLRSENMIRHEAEIFSRPKREWFQSKREKEVSKEAARQAFQTHVTGMGEKIRKRDLSGKAHKRLEHKNQARDGQLIRGKNNAVKHQKMAQERAKQKDKARKVKAAKRSADGREKKPGKPRADAGNTKGKK